MLRPAKGAHQARTTSPDSRAVATVAARHRTDSVRQDSDGRRVIGASEDAKVIEENLDADADEDEPSRDFRGTAEAGSHSLPDRDTGH